MIKKTLATVLLGSFLVALTGCGSDQPPKETKTDQIGFNYDIDYGQTDPFTQNDTFATLAAASPYYLGAQPLHIPSLQDLNEQKKAKVSEAIKLTHELFSQTETLKNQLEEFKNGYLEFIDSALKEEPKLKNFAKDIAKQYVQYQVKEESLLVSYQSITSSDDNPLAKALFEYQKTELALQFADVLVHDLDYLMSTSWQLHELFKGSSKTAITVAWTKYERQLEKLADLNNALTSINEKITAIDFVVKQIKTVDYYTGLASLQFIQENITDLKEKIATIPANAQLSTEDQKFIKDYAGLFETFSKDLQTVALSMDKQEFLDIGQLASNSSLLPQAYADSNSYLATAQKALQATYQGGKKVAGLTWQGAKKVYGAAQTTVGITLDMANALTSGYMNLAVDMYYNVNNKEINASFAKGMNKIYDNYQKGISGVAVLNTAKEYLEAPEKGAESTAANKAEKVFGKGWTSWGVGKTAGLTVDLFTTFGKGIYKLANKSSTAGDYVQGTLDVGLSFVGGSKLIGKGSQAIAGGAEAAPILAEGGLNYMKNTFNKIMKKGAEEEFAALVKFKQAFGELTQAQLDRYINLRLEAIARQVVENMLLESSKALKAKFANFTKNAAGTLGANLTSGGQSYKDFVSKAITNSIKEYFTKDLEAFATENLIKKGGRAGFNILKDYFDNIVGDGAENAVKDKIKDYIDGTNLPGGFPELKDLAGSWDQGQMVITEIEATPEARRAAKEEGCDIALLEEEKGKINPMSITLTPTSDHGGTMTMKGAKDKKAQVVPFTYVDGVISGSFEQSGAKTTIRMNVTQEDNAYSLSGPIEINYQGEGIKIFGNTKAAKKIQP
ncbi:MAG: hypothetical protein HY817_02330 [Candidatus Abawacabacteria bacterium]|nr:hypothetical protein [Candidatus Abawacabacteria bacterium]